MNNPGEKNLTPNPFPKGLSITHKLGLIINNHGPGGSQILKSLPATPDGCYPWFAIRLTTQESAKLGKPTDCLVGRGQSMRELSGFVNAEKEGLPLDGGENVGAGQIWLGAIDVSKPVQTPCDNTHQGNVVLKALCGLQ